MRQHTDLSHQIVDRAVTLASHSSWESLRLQDIAADLHISLIDIYHYFAEKEAISDAWFDRADQHMLNAMQSEEFLMFHNRDKFQHLMLAWLESLAANRKVTRQMILSKLEPGHLHIQIPALLRISRTVQWLREAAYQNSTLPYRAFDEAVVTGIYLVTFCCWLTDDSSRYQLTKRCLEKQLRLASILGFIK